MNVLLIDGRGYLGPALRAALPDVDVADGDYAELTAAALGRHGWVVAYLRDRARDPVWTAYRADPGSAKEAVGRQGVVELAEAQTEGSPSNE